MIGGIALRDVGPFEDAVGELRRWIDSAQAGEMNGDEMLSRAGDIAEHLDDAIVALRRALGW